MEKGVYKICGKEGQSTNVQRHTEAQHLEGAISVEKQASQEMH